MARAPKLLVPAALVLVALVHWLYAPVAGHGFVAYDDDAYVAANPVVREGLSARGLRWAATAAHSSNWHPVTWLSHMLDVELFGLDAGRHHRVSVALHALNAVLLLAALLALGTGTGLALFCALAFAVHPLRVESVAWIAERKDLLAGLFWMLALLGYARFARAPSSRRMLLVALLLALGLAAKPMLVSLPLVLLLLDRWPLARRAPWGALVREKLVLALPVAASCALTLWAQSQSGALRDLAHLPLAERLANAARSLATYALQTLWPHDLAVFHPHPALAPEGWRPWGAGTLAALAGVLLASFLALRLRARAGALWTGWGWYVVALVPVLGLVQVGEQAWAERYAYLPAVGLTLAGGALAGALGERLLPAAHPRRAALVALALVPLVAWSVATRAQVRAWRDTESLFTSAIERTGGSYTAHLNLGLELSRQGRHAEALAELGRALARRPGDRWALYDLALVHLRRGEPEEARARLEQALAGAPRFAAAHGLLGVVRGRLGDAAGARAALETAVALDPEDAAAHGNLGALLAASEPREAARLLRRALALDPGDAGAAERLARLLAGTDDPALRDPREAVRIARGLVRRDPSAGHLATLAAALAAEGALDEAVEAQRAALAAAPPPQRAGLAAELADLEARRSSARGEPR